MINTKMRISEIANPRQVILISTEAQMDVLGKKQLKRDIMAAAWHMPVSFDPMFYAVSIGKERYTLKMVRESRCFVVNFMPSKLKEQILLCGTTTGEHVDKFKEAKFNAVECSKIHCVRIKEALAYLECEVVQEVDIGDHILFISRVADYGFVRGKRLFQVDGENFSGL